jgi:hypothetical protein
MSPQEMPLEKIKNQPVLMEDVITDTREKLGPAPETTPRQTAPVQPPAAPQPVPVLPV